MKTSNVLRKIWSSADSTNFNLFYLYIGRVLEYYSGVKSFSNIDLLDLMSDYSSDVIFLYSLDFFQNPYAGADQGICGFKIVIEHYYFSYAEETLFQDVIKRSHVFNSIEDIIQFSEAWSAMKDPLNNDDFNTLVFSKNGLWDCISQSIPDYFLAAANPDMLDIAIKYNLLWQVFSAFDDECEETGFANQFVCNIRNQAIDFWLSYIKNHDIESCDLEKSKRVLANLVQTDISGSHNATETVLISHEATSPCFDNPIPGTQKRTFQILLYQMGDAPYTSYYGYPELLSYGILSLSFLAAMLDTKSFLEEMQIKYHFLSDGGFHNEQ